LDVHIDDETIEGEHRTIFELFDAFERAPDSTAPSVLDRLLGRLKKQIVVHFAHEELILQEKYEASEAYLALQKADHERLRNAVLDRIDLLRRSNPHDLATGVRTVRGWIEQHIREIDSRINTLEEAVAELE
jgi:hemerythrin-like metal-binding protein